MLKMLKNLSPCSSWNHCWIQTCILKMLSFHILFAWVKHQIVDVNIQDLSYAKNPVVYIEFPMCLKFNFS